MGEENQPPGEVYIQPTLIGWETIIEGKLPGETSQSQSAIETIAAISRVPSTTHLTQGTPKIEEQNPEKFEPIPIFRPEEQVPYRVRQTLVLSGSLPRFLDYLMMQRLPNNQWGTVAESRSVILRDTLHWGDQSPMKVAPNYRSIGVGTQAMLFAASELTVHPERYGRMTHGKNPRPDPIAHVRVTCPDDQELSAGFEQWIKRFEQQFGVEASKWVDSGPDGRITSITNNESARWGYQFSANELARVYNHFYKSKPQAEKSERANKSKIIHHATSKPQTNQK